IGGGGGLAGSASATSTFKQTASSDGQGTGGGGSTGGSNSSGSGTSEAATSVALNLALGGQGGDGATGGDVSVAHGGTVITWGDDAVGINAQSVGGGGGVGGQSSAKGEASASSALTLVMGNIALSGAGGTGASGGAVSVENSGRVQTAGARSVGIGALSVGGGGGSGGVASSESKVDTDKDETGSTTVSLQLALGGSGGDGGVGGDVAVFNVATAGSDDAPVVLTLGDSAHGIHARSIGGGGGDAAMASSRSAQSGGGTAVSLDLALGGSGGTGNTGGNVQVRNEGYVITGGDTAHGVFAQSIGGGGGSAGVTVADAASAGEGSMGLALALGGEGGSGAAAGNVQVDNSGWISTVGARAFAIFAQSVGGGGGDTALTLANRNEVESSGEDADSSTGNSNNSQAQQGSGALQLNLALGGSAGDGGTGGNVSVSNRVQAGVADSGVISTTGEGAHGIFAQSIGGGGGSASLTVASVANAVEGATSLNLALGGQGGSGNRAGSVKVVNDGLVQTRGDAAYGILAQSIGGGGGDGGQSVAMTAAALQGGAVDASVLAGLSGAANLFAGNSGDYFMAVGGHGGDGGNGGDVRVVNNGRIVTFGAGADGIVAQSIGGGGGNSRLGFGSIDGGGSLSLAGVLLSQLGGSNLDGGGKAGTVTVENNGSISVSGAGAVAVRTQAINGGGGVLDQTFTGVDLSAAAADAGSGSSAASGIGSVLGSLLGSRGATHTSGGDVDAGSKGDYAIAGDFSLGELTQSIGGGGGSSLTRVLGGAESVAPRVAFTAASAGNGLSQAMAQAQPTAPALVFAASLGAIGGSNNNGGALRLSHDGMMLLEGSKGVLALHQSIGGGGGESRAQLEGGGSAVQLQLQMGASGAQDSRGGALAYTQRGDVAVAGQDTQGLLLQSIGGGGGVARVSLDAPGAAQAQAQARLGADGGAGLDAGAVDMQVAGNVLDLSANSVALLAQSIGAGGGVALLSQGVGADVQFGARNGAQGDGAAVSMDVQGSVITTGDNSLGVVAQSIGGGGGLLMQSADTAAIGLSGDNQGDAGAVSVQVQGDVLGLGARSVGVLAQSIAGGGGWVAGVGSAAAGGQGSAGAVSVAVSGDVLQTGTDAVGVQAASLGRDGRGNIDVTLAGAVRGGSGAGAGVVIEGGADNHIVVERSLSSVSTLAALAGEGNDLLQNQGSLYGNVDLGNGSNRLLNEAGARLVTYDRLAIGQGSGVAALTSATSGTLVNRGDLHFGLATPQFPIDLAAGAVHANVDDAAAAADNLLLGARVISQVALTGNFVQESSGALYMDVAFGSPASDRLTASGSVALAGTGYFTLASLSNAQWLPILSAAQGSRDDGFQMQDTLALTFKASYRADGVHLSYDPHFQQAWLRDNQNALAAHMNSALLTGSSDGIGRLMALLGNYKAGDEAAYRQVFDLINADGLGSTLYNQVQVQRGFTGSLFGCGRVLDDGRCVWGGISSYDAHRDRTAADLPISLSGSYARFGIDGTLQGPWSISTAFEFDHFSQINVDDGQTRSRGRGVNLGVGVEHDVDNVQSRLSLAAGWSWYDTTRLSPVFDDNAQATSSPRTGYVSLGAGIGTRLGSGGWSLQPRVDARYTLLHHDGLREQGMGDIGYRAGAHNQSLFSVVPSVKLGYEQAVAKSRFGVSTQVAYEVSTRTAVNLPVSLIGANADASAADIQIPIASPALNWRSRLYYGNERVTVGMQYGVQHGSRVGGEVYGVDLRVKF
ncbi:MAG TPA: hypothetical protein DCP40_03640, partial [Stenotrophomonas sp.]|nr:hypothetical protein [Stenotrophomonas sp.]